MPELPAGTGFPFAHRNRLTPSRLDGGEDSMGRRPWPGPPAGLAHTIHSPAATSEIFVVTETGPLPGTRSSIVSTRSKRSPSRGRPLAPVLRPENLTDVG